MDTGEYSRNFRVSGWWKVVLILTLISLIVPTFSIDGVVSQDSASAADVLAVGSVVEVNDPQLYLRSAPGFDSTVLARMELKTRGTVVAGPVTANGLDWYQIRTATYGIGWAAGKYLRLISTPAPAPTPTASAGWAAGSTVEIIDPGLYLRSAPGFDSTVLAKMALGTRGTVVSGPQNASGLSWYQITTTAYGTGWAAARYLKLIPAGSVTPTPTGGMTIGATFETTASSLNLRSGPGLRGRVIAIMAYRTTGTVVAGPVRVDGISWYQIRTSAYGTGWASGSYLQVTSGSAMLTKPTDGLSRLITNGVSGRNEVAITIDAGSDRGWAEEMLDVLKEKNVKVTFGMTGAWAEENPDLLERMVEEGHMLINHTWSHPSFTGFSASPAMTSPSARKSELDRTADFVYEQTGYRMQPWWRPPYGDIDASVRKDMYAAGYWQTVMWSIDSMGWNGATVSQILQSCAWNAEAGDIILLHVGYSSNDYAALEQMITILDDRGFDLVTIEEMLR